VPAAFHSRGILPTRCIYSAHSQYVVPA
jgi:hypothetical protein